MSRKNTLVTPLVLNQSLAASFQTAPTIIQNMDNCSYQINITTSDSTGTFAVEVSNDYSVNTPNGGAVANPGNWVPLSLAGPNSGIPTVAATNDEIVIDLNELPFYAMRLAYTSLSAGTGTCSIYIANKQIGG